MSVVYQAFYYFLTLYDENPGCLSKKGPQLVRFLHFDLKIVQQLFSNEPFTYKTYFYK